MNLDFCSNFRIIILNFWHGCLHRPMKFWIPQKLSAIKTKHVLVQCLIGSSQTLWSIVSRIRFEKNITPLQGITWSSYLLHLVSYKYIKSFLGVPKIPNHNSVRSSNILQYQIATLSWPTQTFWLLKLLLLSLTLGLMCSSLVQLAILQLPSCNGPFQLYQLI